ncbi:MAG: tetratricopeptide repeat protein [Nitrospira sp.]|nr:tetratricopeptide repeat protein [Nitrospira sp.]MDH4251514.1 tetratricopeptide repeat protein [Nitrospira sp.]MDH4344365.1 tetratricopeptide repeat protein [Nitrospira sp.]
MRVMSGIILLAAVTLTACGGPEERKAKYFAKANEYIDAANYPKARVALRNVLKIDPKDAEAYYLFAQVEEKEKNWRNAVQLYQEAVRLVPDHAAALITLAKYYLEARLTEQVVQAADTVLKSNPRHPQASALKIAAQAVTEAAIPSVIPNAEALAKEFPTEPDVAILLATLYGQQRRYREAETTLRRALDSHPRDLDLLNNLSRILTQANNMAGSETVMRLMVAAEPTSIDHRVRLARFYVGQGAQNKAEAVLREAIALDPNSEQRRIMLAELFVNTKDVAAAEQVLLDAAEQIPHSTHIQFGLSALYRKTGQDLKARQRYALLVKEYTDKPVGLEAKVKLAEMDFVEGKQVDAERQVQEVLKANPRSSDGLILTGRMALARRNGKEAVQAFRTVLHDQPELATIHYLLGQAYQLTGDMNLAKDSFERAVALYPDQMDAKRSLAVLESKSGRYQQARIRLDDLLKQRPDDVIALDMLMTLDLVTKNWQGAEQTLTRLRQISTGSNSTALLAEGRFYEAQRRLREASRVYERAVALAPNEPEPLLSLVKVEVALGQAIQSRTRLEALLLSHKDHPFAHGLLGEVLALTREYEGAVLHYREAVRVNPKWMTPWLNWAMLSLSQKKPDIAVQVLEEGLKANPESEELHMLLASARSEQGQIDLAIAAYETTLRLNSRNLLAANNLAVLLVDHKRDPSSLQRAFSLSRDFEKEAPHPFFIDTLGWVRFKMGQQEEAIRLMKQAVSKSPEMSVLNYHLGMALFQSGQRVEARTYLSKALKSSDPFEGRREAEQALAQTRG